MAQNTLSIKATTKINKLLKNTLGIVYSDMAYSKGILIRTKTGRKAWPKPADARLGNFLQHHFEVEVWGTYVYTHIHKCMLQGVLYEIRNNVVVKPNDLEHVPMKARTSQFIYV